MSFKFKDDKGRSVSLGKFFDNIKQSVLTVAEEQIVKDIRLIKDSETGESPKITSMKNTDENIVFEIEGTQEQIDAIKDKFNSN